VKVETWLFASGVGFFTPLAIVYGLVTRWHEPVGVVALGLTTGLALLIGIYLYVTGRRIDERPEDDPVGEIAEGAGELGEFAPFSWWPLPLAASAALIFAGAAIGWWLSLIGIGVGAIALVGWVYEFYRGEHAH
jgi:uncharacterized membrane protein